jgi:hypothetical protein
MTADQRRGVEEEVVIHVTLKKAEIVSVGPSKPAKMRE